MVDIKVLTSDSVIWNKSQVQLDIIDCMSKNCDFNLNLNMEGPDFETLGIQEFLLETAQIFNFDIKKITIVTANALEKNNIFSVQYHPPMHLVDQAKKYQKNFGKHGDMKHFGMFIHRSNAPRLILGSYLDHKYADKSLNTYHYNSSDEFHLSNIGLEDLIKKFNQKDLSVPAAFLSKCPILYPEQKTTIIDKTLSLNPAQQLLRQDRELFCRYYENFFVEVVCESYFTGETFFVTEKTWRPILMKTPFIVQGPRYFLHNLKKLGFKTFEQWWDEGYAEDPSDHQILEIKKILDFLSKKTVNELVDMYTSMQTVLDYNYELFMNLKAQEFFDLRDL